MFDFGHFFYYLDCYIICQIIRQSGHAETVPAVSNTVLDQLLGTIIIPYTVGSLHSSVGFDKDWEIRQITQHLMTEVASPVEFQCAIFSCVWRGPKVIAHP